MKNRHRAACRLCLLLLLVTGAAGCVAEWPHRRQVTPAPAPAASAPSLQGIDPDRLRNRIQGLEARLSGKDAFKGSRRETALELLASYKQVLSELEGFEDPSGTNRTARILMDQIEYLEDRYFQETATAPGRGDLISSLARERKRIQSAYLSEDYKKVVRACADLEASYGPAALSPETGLLFALALGHEGDTRNAIRVARRVLPHLEGRPGLCHLRNRLVAWHLALEERKEASGQYEKLLDAVEERKGLLRRSEDLLGLKDTPSPGPTPSTGTDREEHPDLLKDVLDRVEHLIRSNEFDQARLLLIRHRIRFPEGPKTRAIDRAMERVERAEKERSHGEETPEEESLTREAERLEAIRIRMESEDYEGALKELDEMGEVSDPGIAEEVEALNRTAASKLIQTERDRAARLFLEARNTSDPEEKKRCLRSSHAILHELLQRFPGSPLAPKIRSNLDTVTGEMERMGLEPKDR